MMKTYTEMMKFETFEDRFNYLKLDGVVGSETFGCDRYLNQMLYSSSEWKRFRRDVILRDCGCDMGLEGFDINTNFAVIHHINPLTIDDIRDRRFCVFDMDNVVLVSKRTHLSIHYGKMNRMPSQIVERHANDTIPWKTR